MAKITEMCNTSSLFTLALSSAFFVFVQKPRQTIIIGFSQVQADNVRQRKDSPCIWQLI